MPPKKKRARKPPAPRVLLGPLHLLVTNIPGKGKGVVARYDLQPNSRLIYLGEGLDQPVWLKR
jgi:hypothetical protein